MRALTFDVVGTLIDFEAGLLQAARPPSGEAFLAAFGEAEAE